MNSKVIICDLDGTLAPSKFDLEPDMAEVICKVLAKHRLAVVSGGSYAQFEKQFLRHLQCGGELLKNLYLFPTNGSVSYIYDNIGNAWQVYDEQMTREERDKIISAFAVAVPQAGVDVSDPYGSLIDDRGGEINFSGRGQEAPLDIKTKWDPDHVKRQKIVEKLHTHIPEFDIRIGGTTSIEVTHPGITKAYAIRKMEELVGIGQKDIIFIGDALYSGGNDSSVKETGVECISVTGPADTKKYLHELLAKE